MNITLRQVWALYQPDNQGAALQKLAHLPLTQARRHSLRKLLTATDALAKQIEESRQELVRKYGNETSDGQWAVDLASEQGIAFAVEWNEYLAIEEALPDFRLTEAEVDSFLLSLAEENAIGWMLPECE